MRAHFDRIFSFNTFFKKKKTLTTTDAHKNTYSVFGITDSSDCIIFSYYIK